MSDAMLLKIFLAAVLAASMSWAIYYQNRRAGETLDPDDKGVRYLTCVSGWLLPLFMALITLAGLLAYGIPATARMILSTCFSIFLSIALYYLLLLPLLPFLRRHFRAQTCAMLWLLPAYTYITQQSYMESPEPLLIIRAPARLVWILFSLWLLGALAILAWKLVSHLAFRRRILRNAVTVTDPATLSVWEAELRQANLRKPRFRLVRSPAVTTPLSVGLFRGRIRVVLPDRSYSAQELALIFRHELIHISREDSWSKFFLVFCTAMCWFNPFLWVAMKKSAEDLELSCDETVLVKADAGTRRRYAELILQTAGDSRGFTTCLSASATSLRYRLRQIVRPGRKHSGALLAGLIFFGFCMTCGNVALAYENGTGEERIYAFQDAQLYSLSYLSVGDGSVQATARCRDPEALRRYLSALELYRLTGNYSFPDSSRQCFFLYDTPEGTLGLILDDQTIQVTPLWENARTETYYLPEGPEWAYLDTLIEPD